MIGPVVALVRDDAGRVASNKGAFTNHTERPRREGGESPVASTAAAWDAGVCHRRELEHEMPPER
jgi:hypothetical protein